MRLAGKRVLVVGASSGLGKASAIEIAREGGHVCVAARRTDRLEQTVDEAGNEAFAVACDVGDEASCTRAVGRAVDEMGGLDAVVYAPGISTFGPIERIHAADWHRVLSTNLVGLSLILNAAIESLEASRGRVAVISSIVIDDSPPRPFQATYTVSKNALETLVECWQNEHRAVSFTSIACGDTFSEFGHDEDDMEKMIAIVKQWDELEYRNGRIMESVAVAEQVVNAVGARESVRRIAITPSFPEAVGEISASTAEDALNLIREKGT